MKKIIKLVFLLTIIINSNITAQVSGYMGKRFLISWNTYSSPNFYALYSENGYYDVAKKTTKPSFLQLNNRIEASYIISRHIGLGLNVGLINTRSYFIEQRLDSSESNYSGDYQVNYFQNSNKVSGYSIGFTYKYYYSNWIAPLGKYFQIDIFRSYFKITDFYNKPNFSKVKNLNLNLKSLGINFTFGKSRVYFDRIIISTGLQLGVSDGLLYTNSSMQTIYDYDNEDIYLLRKNSRAWYAWSTLFNFHLGIGFLAF